MCFTMEEVWQARPPSEDKSVHMELFRDAPEAWHDDSLGAFMNRVRETRSAIYEKIEPLRKDGTIKSNLEARVDISVLGDDMHCVDYLDLDFENEYSSPENPRDTLADFVIVSECNMSVGDEEIKVSALTELERYSKCERSWKYFKGEGDITPRDAAAVATLEA